MLAPIVQFELQATHLTKINARRKLITNWEHRCNCADRNFR
jgi:hypothetical protein